MTWVACSKRMPPQSVPVIVCSDSGIVQWITWFWDGKEWHCEGSDDVDPIPRAAISYWQPLPKRPRAFG